METFVKIEAEVIELPKSDLINDYENDISYYFDSEWGNANWMTYQDGYIILDCGSGKVFYLIVK